MFQQYVLTPFLEAINKFENSNAFCINEEFHTYGEFGQYISKIRIALQKSGVNSTNIGLVANDDIETYASIFAIWLEGIAYVPLHPNQPIERSLEIVSQANIEIILNSSKENLFTGFQTIKTGDLGFSEIHLVPKPVSESSLAYILFTSGSTGKPKGVPIMRSNVGAFMKSFTEIGFKIDEFDRCLQCFDLTFDVSVQSYLVPLTKGACTYTIPHSQIKYSYVYGLLEQHKLTFGAMAPSMIRYLRPYFSEILTTNMRYCILTAEASPLLLVEEWSSCIPNAKIYDFYGPTEATIYCTYKEFERSRPNKSLNGMLSIGKAMNGLTAIIIDEEKNSLGVNQKGELCISGPQLTPGYWNNEEKNNNSFFEMQINGNIHRFYRTGDLCYFDEEFDIMYSGRLDFQVKIQGYRVEMGEIEFHTRTYLKDNNVVAIPFKNDTGNNEIALIIEGKKKSNTDLIAYLKTKLPPYMIPTKIFFEHLFPINTSNKVDRQKLKEIIN